MVRLVFTGFLFLLLAWAQAETPTARAEGEFFSGNVTALSEGKITVSRTVLGKESATRTFLITPETKIEGKPRVRSRVTVRFVSSDDGDKAVHIIVRAPTPKK